jgi:monosaccharide-transporting ATPase
VVHPPLLTITALSKRFPGVQALDRVDLDVAQGEVHALMGQNGAGKSTLIKVLTGVYRPDAGSISFRGRPFHARSPVHAQRHGISTVYQEINLVPTLSVAENLFLGRMPRGPLGLNWKATRTRAAALLSRFGLALDVNRAVGTYPVAIQQMIAIARAVDLDAKLLILDEPTSSLDARETAVLFALIARLRSEGLSIIFVTHFLDQVYRIADRITVLRNGRRVGTFAAADVPRLQLVAHMLGRSSEDPAPAARESTASSSGRGAEPPPLLRIRGLGRRGAIAPFDADIRQGEVLGLAGLLGSGRTEAARLIFGAERADTGRVEMDGKPLRPHPRRSIRAGQGFCPEDRKAEGLIPGMSIRQNIMLVLQRRLGRLGLISRRRQQKIAADLASRLGLSTTDLDRPVGTLSGGNQQKVILARWLAAAPRLLILDEPTRGIDVGAKADVERLIADLSSPAGGAKGGAVSILFISAELDEVARRSTRILVLRDRRVVGELRGPDLTEHTIMRTIAGPGT